MLGRKLFQHDRNFVLGNKILLCKNVFLVNNDVFQITMSVLSTMAGVMRMLLVSILPVVSDVSAMKGSKEMDMSALVSIFVNLSFVLS